MASAMGIRTPWVDALTFGLGSAIAGIAGVALSQIDNVSPTPGQGYIIDSFMVVVFGGVGNLWGTLIAALSLGVANKGVTSDGLFSLEEVECIGACSWAPAAQVNYDFHENLTPASVDKVIADYREKGSK